VGISGGIFKTWSAGINNRAPGAESDKGFLGALTLTAPDSMGVLAGSALYLGYADGYASLIGNDVRSMYAGATVATPIKGVKVGASADYAEANQNGAGAGGSGLSLAGYASVAATEKLSFHFRGEWAKINPTLFSAQGTIPNTIAGIPKEVLAFTGTIQYDLWANVLTRLEVRWDHALEGSPFGGSTSGTPAGGGTADERDSVLVAANIIYKF
jgi:hypothetical protein